jgi:hypothetical protein
LDKTGCPGSKTETNYRMSKQYAKRSVYLCDLDPSLVETALISKISCSVGSRSYLWRVNFRYHLLRCSIAYPSGCATQGYAQCNLWRLHHPWRFLGEAGRWFIIRHSTNVLRLICLDRSLWMSGSRMCCRYMLTVLK